MKIALINENSQAGKNSIIFKELQEARIKQTELMKKDLYKKYIVKSAKSQSLQKLFKNSGIILCEYWHKE